MFDDFTDEQLKEELDKRKKAARKNGRPVQFASLDCTKLRELGESYISDVEENTGYTDDDYQHWFYEVAVETLYGKDIWNWIEKHG